MNVMEPILSDVLCGNQRNCRDHPGTVFLRDECIEVMQSAYDGAEKCAKMDITVRITLQVYARQGRFLVRDEGVWKKLGFKQARRRVTTMICNRFRTYRKQGSQDKLPDGLRRESDGSVESLRFSSLSSEDWIGHCLDGTSLVGSSRGSTSHRRPSGASNLGGNDVAEVPRAIARDPNPCGVYNTTFDLLEISTRQALSSLRVSDNGSQTRSMEVSFQKELEQLSMKNSETATGLVSDNDLQPMAFNADTSSSRSRGDKSNHRASHVRGAERRGQDDMLTVGTASGGVQQVSAIVAHMKDTLQDANSQVRLIGDLTVLGWKKWTNRGVIGEAGGIKGVIAAMGHHYELPEVQRCGCLALTWLASWGNQESIAAAGGIEQIIASMLQHVYDGPVQHRACEVLAELVGGHRQAIVSAGGVERLVGAMKRHLSNEEVQRHGCRALGGLASFCTTTQDLIVLRGGIGIVVDAMIHHVPNEYVQRHGLWTLAILAEASKDNQEIITDSGGIGAMVEAMQCHLDNSDLQHVGSRSLARLARENSINQDLIAGSGGIRALFRAMQRHEDDDHVQGSVCFAFGCLAYQNKGNQMLIRRLNAQDAIKKASSKFADDDWLQRCAEYALEMIGIPVLCDGYHYGY